MCLLLARVIGDPMSIRFARNSTCRKCGAPRPAARHNWLPGILCLSVLMNHGISHEMTTVFCVTCYMSISCSILVPVFDSPFLQLGLFHSIKYLLICPYITLSPNPKKP